MRDIKRLSRERRRGRPRSNSRRAGLIVILAVIGMVVIGSIVFAFRQRAGLAPGTFARRPIPPYYDNIDRARPFPRTLLPAQFTQPSVIRAYSVAQRIPEILGQQPCYCGCHRMGHKSLLACFASDHGATCRVCLKETLLADNLERQGKSARYIRSSIIAGQWWGVKLD